MFTAAVIEFYDRKDRSKHGKKKEMDREGRWIRLKRLHKQTDECMDGRTDGKTDRLTD